MRLLIIALLSFFATAQVQAQAADRSEVQATADAFAERYQLDADQAEKAYKIAERLHRNQAEIAPLQASNRSLYLQKKNAIREGTTASIRYLLTESQMPLLNAELIERRKQESKLIDRLKAEGASREEIQLALWDMD